MYIQSNRDFEKALKKYPTLKDNLKAGKDPVEALKDAGIQIGSPLQTDKWIYRLVVSFLGLAIMIAMCGSIMLASTKDANVPEILIAIGSAAVGALAGLLAPSPGSK